MSDTPPSYPPDLNNIRVTRSMVSSTDGQGTALQMKMSPSSYIKLSTENMPEPIRKILLHTFSSRDADIYIYIPEFKSEWVFQDMFGYLVGGLIDYNVKLRIKDRMRRRFHRRVVHCRGFSRYTKMKAITAVAMAMKIRGNDDAFATVFSFSPSIIAEDFRLCRMGAAIDTQATCRLLTSIFLWLRRNDYQNRGRDSELIIAAANLLVAHIGRDDHRYALTISSDNPRLSFERLLETITPNCVEDDEFNRDLYINMAGLRDGIIFGAMLRYAHDITNITREHVDILNLFGRMALTMITAGLIAAPGGGIATNIVTSGGDALGTFQNITLRRSNPDPTLPEQINRDFYLRIEDPAQTGAIPGLMGVVSVDISTCYARRVKGIMQSLAGS